MVFKVISIGNEDVSDLVGIRQFIKCQMFCNKDIILLLKLML